ncbi:MAG: M50 family metallopeptidase [Clostridia bacterium]|nr:M50 family metallopeptidase [Clostridia bacterium]
MIWGIIVGIIMLLMVIISHELGHFFAGKALGFRVLEFAIGFGPKLWSRQKGETLYSVRAFPIGGFCKFDGEDQEAQDAAAFNNRPKWRRAVVLAAGGIGNVVAAYLAVVVLFFAWGVPGPPRPYVDEVVPGSSAEQIGLLPGDLITQWNGQSVEYGYELALPDTLTEGDTVDLTVQRGNETLSFSPVLKLSDDGRPLIGITRSDNPSYERVGFFSTFNYAGKQVFLGVRLVVEALGDIVFKGDVEHVGGVVMIVNEVNTAAREFGAPMVLLICAMISVNLGIMNILPLPALDGGRILLLAVEAIRRKPLKREVEGMIHAVGLAAFCVLAVIMVFYDIIRL